MTRVLASLLGRVRCVAALLAACGAIGAAGAQAPSQLVVTYVEPTVAGAATVARTLRDYAAGVGAPSVVLLAEIGRPQRLAVIERWSEGQVPADGVVQQRLDGRLEAPVDRRVHRAIGALLDAGVAAPFHMLMHVDVVPAGAQTAATLLDGQRAAVMAAPGARGFEVAVQPDRPNHFAVHEAWASRAAYEAYAAGAAAQGLRRQLAAFKGALFDDRFYVPIAIPRSPQ